MKLIFVMFSLLGSVAWAELGVVVDVRLTPAGSFKAKTNEIEGEAILDGKIVRAKNIVVHLENLKTGISLRDKHTTKRYLEVDKYPNAVLTSAVGKDGRGSGKLKIRGIEKNIEGRYKISDNELTADFDVSLSDYGIKGIKYMGVGVNDQITLHVTIPINKK